MTNGEQGYLDLMRKIRDEGATKTDRTGTGTKSLFAPQLRFNLAEGFPLLTTKRVHFKSVLHELLWFLRGETNTRYLEENGVTIWRKWADANGELGPVYGHAWRRWGAKPAAVPQPTPRLRDGVEATVLGVANGAGASSHPLGKTWQGLIERCYRPDSDSYRYYGRRGVSVCDAWLEFARFAEDAYRLPGGEDKRRDDSLVLDKDGRGDGWSYGPDRCQWITPQLNAELRADKTIVVERVADGQRFSFRNASAFAAHHGFDAKNFSDLWTGAKNAQVRSGFKLVETIPDQPPAIDQLGEAIQLLRTSPDSRRIIVTAWDPATFRRCRLPPCHMTYQFWVDDRKRLSCHMLQRSADYFLGVPFNIASYALLTELVAHVTGHKAGELAITFVDCHLYLNHLAQVEEQLSRTPNEPPWIELNPQIREIDDFKYEDVRLHGYECHPPIAAQVAV